MNLVLYSVWHVILFCICWCYSSKDCSLNINICVNQDIKPNIYPKILTKSKRENLL